MKIITLFIAWLIGYYYVPCETKEQNDYKHLAQKSTK